jgi:hypothetical protein
MSKHAPTIENAWEAFERDLRANAMSPEDIELYKLMWMGGAMAMGVILTSRENTGQDKVDAFHMVATWLAERPQLARFSERFHKATH